MQTVSTQLKCYITIINVSKKAKIRNQYNQVPHLTQHTTWESDKIQENITHKRAKLTGHFQSFFNNWSFSELFFGISITNSKISKVNQQSVLNL